MTKLLWMHKTHRSTGCVKNFDNIAEKFSDASVGSSHLSADNCLWEQSAEQTVSRASYSQPHHIYHFMTMVIITNKKNSNMARNRTKKLSLLVNSRSRGWTNLWAMAAESQINSLPGQPQQAGSCELLWALDCPGTDEDVLLTVSSCKVMQWQLLSQM